VAAVLRVLYLIFNEGYTASSGSALQRVELTAEAIRLTRQLHRQLPQDGEVDLALELVGTPTLPDTLRATAIHGVVCFTGMLSNQWIVRDFYPIDFLPRGVRLTAHSGDARDLPAAVLQSFLDAVAAGHLTVPVHRTYTLDEIATAHADMEAGRATGKLVVLP
jgi:NADPH2:quinone reductase